MSMRIEDAKAIISLLTAQAHHQGFAFVELLSVTAMTLPGEFSNNARSRTLAETLTIERISKKTINYWRHGVDVRLPEGEARAAIIEKLSAILQRNIEAAIGDGSSLDALADAKNQFEAGLRVEQWKIALAVQKAEAEAKRATLEAEGWIDCTGDAAPGDVIRFTEAVYASGRKPIRLGERTITAKIIKDSYGKAKQQHTFILAVLECSGFQAIDVGKHILRKGRVVYRNGTVRRRWENETDRYVALADKHLRGREARKVRRDRRIAAGLERPWWREEDYIQ